MKYLLMVCLMGLNLGTGFAAEPLENFTAKIFNTAGKVECLKTGAIYWVEAKPPYMLEAGDQVRTAPGAMAEIYMKYGSKIRLGEEASFTVNTVAPEGNVVSVLHGKMQAWIRKFTGRRFSVRTPSAVCAVRGTVFDVEVTEAGQTTWNLFSGEIDVTDNMNRTIGMLPDHSIKVTQAEGVSEPTALPPGVTAPSEPAKTPEEKEETKAEKKITQAAADAAASAADKAAGKTEDATVLSDVVEPVTSVIPTATVLEACEVSASSPDCQTMSPTTLLKPF